MPTREVTRNVILNHIDLTFLEARTLASPSTYQVAVSSACDFACPYCMRESLGIREDALMSFEQLAEHESAFRTARRVALFGLGEPFLHPRFFDFVQMCRKIGVATMTSSHGQSLVPDIREKIIDSGLDDLTVSMDGADKQTFERLRVNGRFDEIVFNLTALAELKRQRQVDHPAININMTVMRQNVTQIPSMVRLASRIGAQSVTISSLIAYRKSDIGNCVADSPRFEKYMEKARTTATSLGISFSYWRQKPIGWIPLKSIPKTPHGCSQLWSSQIIETDGRMKQCCYVEQDLANAFELGPEAAFNTQALLRERNRLLNGDIRVECQGCLYLRDRSPARTQAQLNEASRLTAESPELTDADRRELFKIIDEYQAKKTELFPNHSHRVVQEDKPNLQTHSPEPRIERRLQSSSTG